MVRTLLRSALREIRQSMGRYLAILAIVGLGVGFFAGLRACQPAMMATGVDYLAEQAMYDYRVLSTLGFTEEDVADFAALEGVSEAKGAVYTDFLTEIGDSGEVVVRAHSLTGGVNRPKLAAGRMPEAPDECLADARYLPESVIGTALEVGEANDEDTKELLRCGSYTIVGLAWSPYYLNYERGTSSIGSGSVAAFVYIPEDGFDFEAYYEVFLAMEQPGAAYSNAYADQSDGMKPSVEELTALRAGKRYETLLSDAEAEISDAEQEVLDGWAEYYEKRADAEAELNDAYQELTEGEEDYRQGEEDYLQGREDYEQGRREFTDGQRKVIDAQEALEDAEQEVADGAKELADARQELDDGWKEYNQAKEDARRELEEAYQKLADGEAEYAEGLEEYNDGLRQLADSEAELDAGDRELAEGAKELAEGEAELAASWAQLEAAKRELSASKAQLDEVKAALDASKGQLDEAERAYAAAYQEFLAVADSLPPEERAAQEAAFALQRGMLDQSAAQYEAGLAQYEEGLAQYQQGQQQYEAGLAQYQQGAARLETARQQYQAGVAQLEAGQQKLNDARKKLDEAKQQLDDARKELDDGWKEYEDGKAEADEELAKAYRELADGEAEYADGLQEWEDGRQKLEDARQELADAQQELADARRELDDARSELDRAPGELADARRELDDGWKEYEDGKAEADQEFADAEAELEDAERKLADARGELADLKPATTYVLTREENTGYVCFDNDTSIVAAVSVVFPVFFFLVAALVCMTTMTRMVDEQRTQIGVLKALGYSNGQIMSKYLFYAGSAALIGSAAGYAIGSVGLPWVIWEIYGMIYGFAPLKQVFQPELAAVSFVAALLCSMGATYFSCRVELSRQASDLIRPKTPKAGRRVFLEYVTPLWKRLSFLHKVSARNVLRYRSRLVMMVLGIGGCTALLCTGFGIRDSIAHVADDQFDEITLYDYAVTFQDGQTQESAAAYLERYGWDEGEALLAHSGSVDVLAGKGSKSVYLVVSSTGSLDGFLSLHSGGEAIPYPGEGEVVLNSGLAESLGIQKGDRIGLRDEDLGTMEATVSGLCDNYVFNYAYVSVETYASQLGRVPEFNTLYVLAHEGADPYEEGALLLEDKDVGSVTVNAASRDRVDSMLSRLDYIVLVVVLCAAALAFIVLYNLTNINVTERIREIATIKVLGFYQNEVASYVFREINILSVLGGLIGLGMGKALHAFVMAQIKIDAMTFACRIAPVSYLISFVMTMLFTVLICTCMRPRLRKIDMAESLKSIE